jgi:hypothetical protein
MPAKVKGSKVVRKRALVFPKNRIKKREYHHGLHGAPFLAFKKNMDM